ncbi:hypothetical protein Tco_0653922, partial [Tanacetum coccineum]
MPCPCDLRGIGIAEKTFKINLKTIFLKRDKIKLELVTLALGTTSDLPTTALHTTGFSARIVMAEGEIDNLTIEQYLALTRGNQASGVVKPKIGGNVNFDIKNQFMRELREDTFSGNKNDRYTTIPKAGTKLLHRAYFSCSWDTLWDLNTKSGNDPLLKLEDMEEVFDFSENHRTFPSRLIRHSLARCELEEEVVVQSNR